jgi:proteasome accessory factor A
MGSETEYAIACRAGSGSAAPEDVVPHLVHEVARSFPALPDVSENVSCYLGNGGRVYREIGGKMEYATPECSSPEEVARYDKAGEQILARARSSLLERRPEWQISIFKNNVGAVAPEDTTWGNHESYTCWIALERALKPLLGHLVSRLFYAGAGILAFRAGGIGFELSQRARHLVQITGPETTGARPLFGTRLRKASDFSPQGWVRAHLICKDSQRSPFGIYLTFGTTGLLFHLLSTGRGVGHHLAPADPIAAVQAVSQDPWLKMPVALENGRKLTALEIQWEYLEACERAVRGGDAPDWAGRLLRHWRETLDAWARDPLSLAGRLDTACKLKVIDRVLRRADIEWNDLNDALKALGGLRQSLPPGVVRAVLAGDPDGLPAQERAKFSRVRMETTKGRAVHLDRLRLAARLQALDLSYHELGGLYDTLEAGGEVTGVVIDRADVDRAVSEPPPAGRAAFRGNFIRQHQNEGWACNWMGLVHRASGQVIHLADPFADQPSATTQGRPQPTVPSPDEMESAVEEAIRHLELGRAPTEREWLASFLPRVLRRR